MILERMQKRSEEKKQREDDLKSEYPTFSEKQLFLPPLRQKSLESKTILSGKRAINLSVNMYNQGGIQHFSKSPRFEVKK